jgi:threonyl-tRNA synthetase
VSSPPVPLPTVADSVRVTAGTTAGQAVRDAGLPSSGPQAVVVVRAPDGVLKDLAWTPAEDVDVAPVAATRPRT